MQEHQGTTTKADIIQMACDKTKISKQQVTEVIELFFETLKKNLERGKNIKISSFGNFVLRNKRPRPGRNPQTGKYIEITARQVLTFRPSPLFKDQVNK